MRIYQNAIDHAVEKAREEVARMARDILAESQRLVPVDTGRLRASGRVSETATGAEVAYDAPYAAHVENGTGRSPAQPYLTPAALKRRD